MASSVSPPPLTDLLGGNAVSTTETTPSEYIPPIPHHTTSSSFGNLSPSILIIILILAITLIASVSLCFLLRHLNRRCLRHLSSSSSSDAGAASSSSAAAISSRRVSPEITTSDSLLESLPLFPFSSITRPRSGAEASAEADCAVCLSKFEPDDQLRLLPLCCHAFHALCVDTWLRSNQTCPLCRSPIFATEAEILKTLGRGGDSFRIEIGSVSRRETTPFDAGDSRRRSRSYSLGSFDYFVEEESELVVARNNASSEFKDENRREVITPGMAMATATEESLAADVASSGRSWLKDYVDRLSMSLSSRAASFRSSGRFFSGSSRRSDVVLGEWDLEASRVGEEISELFRWVSGV